MNKVWRYPRTKGKSEADGEQYIYTLVRYHAYLNIDFLRMRSNLSSRLHPWGWLSRKGSVTTWRRCPSHRGCAQFAREQRTLRGRFSPKKHPAGLGKSWESWFQGLLARLYRSWSGLFLAIGNCVCVPLRLLRNFEGRYGRLLPTYEIQKSHRPQCGCIRFCLYQPWWGNEGGRHWFAEWSWRG